MTDDPGRRRGLAEALQQALRRDPFYATLEAAIEPAISAREAMLAYYDYSISEAADLGRCVAADAPDAGVSLWSLPLDADAAARKSAAKSAFVRDRLCAGSAEVYERIVAYMSVATMEVTEPDDWYLSIIGILPDHQGRGLGGDLVRPVLEEADRAGRATYLETFTPRNISFYERLGYRAVGAFDEPVTGGTYTVLRRLPV